MASNLVQDRPMRTATIITTTRTRKMQIAPYFMIQKEGGRREEEGGRELGLRSQRDVTRRERDKEGKKAFFSWFSLPCFTSTEKLVLSFCLFCLNCVVLCCVVLCCVLRVKMKTSRKKCLDLENGAFQLAEDLHSQFRENVQC